MSKKIVRKSIDLSAPPPLTQAQKAEIYSLVLKPESEIDYSDIPPLTEAFWENAVRGQFCKPSKTMTMVRVDADILAWLKKNGQGYHKKMNAILREAMERDVLPNQS